MKRRFWRKGSGFTLVELTVSAAVLALLLLLIGQLFNSATEAVGVRGKRMDADGEARAVFSRMAIDFSQMIRRADIDYFLKSSTNDPSGKNNLQPGNDRMAFFAEAPGYSAAGSGNRRQACVAAWRVEPDSAQLQRYGSGLLWNGVSNSDSALLFAGPTGPLNTDAPENAISTRWPAAISPNAADARYENAGPLVFRLEYFYLLKGQTVAGVTYPSSASETPWDIRIPSHQSVDGLRDVAAIAVVIAVADPGSRRIVSPDKLVDLAAKMPDFSQAAMQTAGELEAQWQTVINDPANGIPASAASALRIYQRTFFLPPQI